MDFGALAQLIKSSLAQNLPLDTSKLRSTSITQISNDVFPQNLIHLDISQTKNAYEEDPKTQRVIVRGKGVDLPFKGLDSEIQFYLIGDQAALTWTATGDAKWTLGAAFPELQKTICDEIRFSNTPPPQLILNSDDKTHQGMSFVGTIDLSAMTAGFAGLLGISTLKISGPLVLKDNGATLKDIDFTAPDIGPINLGIATVTHLGFAIKSQFITNRIRKSSYIAPYMLLSTEIPFTSQGESHPIPISVRVVDLQSDIRFSADPTALIDAGLDDLESLTNNTNLKEFKLPNNFHIEDVVKFTDFFFDFNLKSKKVTLIGIAVESARPWTMLHLNASQQDLILEKVGLSLQLIDPFGKKVPSVTLSGEVEFGKAEKDPGVLVFIATYPNWSVEGHLREGTRLSLAETLQGFLGTTAPVAALEVDKFEFYLAKGNYSIALDLKGDWDIPLGSTGVGLGIEQLGFSVNHQPDGTEASAVGEFSFATISVHITANHPAGATDGWTFTGKAIAESEISISHFLKETVDPRFPGSSSSVPPMLDVAIKSLGVDFNTQSKDFHFDTEIDLGSDLKTALTFAKLKQEGTTPPAFEKRATGVITVFPCKPNEFAFDLGVDLKPDGKHIVALYKNTAGKEISISDLVKAMFPDADSLTLPDFGITIKDGIVGYVSGAQAGDTSQSVFALDMDASIDLTSLGNIPLVGKTLSAAKTLKFAFQLLYPASKDNKPFAKADLEALNKLITVAGPQFPADADLTELKLKTELRIGNSAPIDFNLPVKVNSNGQFENKPATFNPPAGSQSTDDGVKWFQLNQEFGPVHLQRVGVKFDNGELTALLDGGLTAFGLEVDLMGLSVSSKITGLKNGQFEPHFSLQGLGLSFSKGGVSFTGALIHLKDEYDGLATVQAEGLRLAAIGSLKTVKDQTALFLYAVLDYALGGSPFFYVTGLAAGFGLNQKLTMPAVDQVSTFPLVAAAKQPPTIPTDPGSAGPFIKNEVQKLSTYLTPTIGQYFGCAGIEFTSFELLDSFLLISISFGREFELDLVGLSTLVVPPDLPANEPALATVTLQIVGSFIPSEGIAIVQGRLTNDSHILDPNCHLTGGFAFATWFGTNAHAGDFVISLGGYHPDFQKPDHYPTVPRIGINWKISTELSITGGLYFALTPCALMAGGAMKAIFQTHLDLTIATVDVKAWFIMGADFIVYWKPFHYCAHLYVDIGIDVVIHFLGTHEISFDVGADLQVWGPKFGGHARVYVKVIGIKIGFNVDFGATDKPPLPLDWSDFRKSFLPADDKIVSVAINEGLVRKIAPNNDADYWYVINPKDFRLRTNSVIPIKSLTTTINSEVASAPINKDFGIAPMGKHDVDTSHHIKVTRNNQPADTGFKLSPIQASVPGGLWAHENSMDVNAHSLIDNVIVGYEIVAAKPPTPGQTAAINRELLSYTTHDMSNAYSDASIQGFTGTVPGDDPAENNKIWTQIQTEIHTNPTRDQMLTAMGFAKTDLDIGEAFTTDAAYAPSYGALS